MKEDRTIMYDIKHLTLCQAQYKAFSRYILTEFNNRVQGDLQFFLFHR